MAQNTRRNHMVTHLAFIIKNGEKQKTPALNNRKRRKAKSTQKKQKHSYLIDGRTCISNISIQSRIVGGNRIPLLALRDRKISSSSDGLSHRTGTQLAERIFQSLHVRRHRRFHHRHPHLQRSSAVRNARRSLAMALGLLEDLESDQNCHLHHAEHESCSQQTL